MSELEYQEYLEGQQEKQPNREYLENYLEGKKQT